MRAGGLTVSGKQPAARGTHSFREQDPDLFEERAYKEQTPRQQHNSREQKKVNTVMGKVGTRNWNEREGVTRMGDGQQPSEGQTWPPGQRVSACWDKETL